MQMGFRKPCVLDQQPRSVADDKGLECLPTPLDGDLDTNGLFLHGAVRL